MTDISSRTPDLLDTLVDLFTAGMAAPGTEDVQVFDGPPVTSDPLEEVVYVGWDGDTESEDAMATFEQRYTGAVGTERRDEQISVTCLIGVWSGDTEADMRRTVRRRAFEILGVIQDLLRADPRLEFPPPTIVQLAGGQYHPIQLDKGFQGLLPFQINMLTRI